MAISRRDVIAAAAAFSGPSLIGQTAKAQPAPASPVHLLRGKLKGRVYTFGDPLYNLARRGLGTTPVHDRFPAAVVLPESPDDIARALEFARTQGLDLSVRAGGHDILGASTTSAGVLLDLSRMNAVSLDPATGVARAGGGVRSGELNLVGAPHGLAPVLGMSPHIGVGGVTLGGGIGWLCGTYGAAVDHLLVVDLVTADGRRLRAAADENPDLFWALRGGGGNFGVATTFTYQMKPVAPVLAGRVSYRVDPRRFLRFLRTFLAASPDGLDIGTTISVGADPVATIAVCWAGNADEGERGLRPLRTYAPAIADNIKLQGYAAFANGSPLSARENLFWRAGSFDALSDRVIDAIASVVESGVGQADCAVGVLHYMHGALCRAPKAATPFIRTPGRILYTVNASWQGAVQPQAKVDWVLTAAAALQPASGKQTYVNYLSLDGEKPVSDAFGAHYRRLRAVKGRYDPDNVFHNNRNIRT